MFFCGDVMPGRGIDQILPFSVNPQIFEPYVKNAGDYVKLAERLHGPIPCKVDFDYVWGAALDEFKKHRPAAKIINLETSVTKGGEPWPGKGIQYRMHPGNVPLLTCAGVDICVLANNHVLDWGYGIPSAHRRFAHLLLDGGVVDLVHGHSSHHVKSIEVYKDKLILYGCGDLITDYEGISGHDAYRGDLGLLYFVRLDTLTRKLIGVRMVPMTMHRLQLRRASRRDALWLKDRLSREGRELGTWVEMHKEGDLSLCWEKREAGV